MMALYTPEVQADVDRAKQAADLMVSAGHTTGARERKVPRWGPEQQAAETALAPDPCDDPKVTGPEVWQQSTSAHSICSRAAEIVRGDRAAQHGPKERNHTNIAVLWEAYMQLKEANGESTRYIDAYDVATMMELLKIARRFAGAGRTNLDNYVDGAGYCSIAGEIALSGKEMRYGPSS